MNTFPMSYSSDHDWKLQIIDSYIQGIKNPYVLIMGSSHSNQDINSELLQYNIRQKNPDIQVFNLAHSGGIPESNLFLLKHIIKNNRKPSLLIYDFSTPWLFNKSYLTRSDTVPQLFSNSYLGKCKNVTKTYFFNKINCFLLENIYSYRFLINIKNTIISLPQYIINPKTSFTFTDFGQPSRGGWIPLYLHTSQSVFDSFYSPTGVNYYQRKKDIQIQFDNFKWTNTSMRSFLRYTSSEQIPVLVIWFPEYKTKKDYYVEFKVPVSIFENEFASYNNIPYISSLDLRNKYSDQKYFADYEHLNTTGATKLTEDLSEILINEEVYQFKN
jgi:hypothetical protein